MSRLLLFAVPLVLILTAGLFVLAGRNSEKPLARVEKVVPLASLQK